MHHCQFSVSGTWAGRQRPAPPLLLLRIRYIVKHHFTERHGDIERLARESQWLPTSWTTSSSISTQKKKNTSLQYFFFFFFFLYWGKELLGEGASTTGWNGDGKMMDDYRSRDSHQHPPSLPCRRIIFLLSFRLFFLCFCFKFIFICTWRAILLLTLIPPNRWTQHAHSRFSISPSVCIAAAEAVHLNYECKRHPQSPEPSLCQHQPNFPHSQTISRPRLYFWLAASNILSFVCRHLVSYPDSCLLPISNCLSLFKKERKTRTYKQRLMHWLGNFTCWFLGIARSSGSLVTSPWLKCRRNRSLTRSDSPMKKVNPTGFFLLPSRRPPSPPLHPPSMAIRRSLKRTTTTTLIYRREANGLPRLNSSSPL